MKAYFYFIKFNLLRQIRSYKFLIILSLGIFLGFLCVPAETAGYEVIYLCGVRGIYNSAWLGGIGAILPAIILWLPGFYLLRSQISEDKRLKMGNIIASTRISKLGYIMGKAFSNFIVLATLVLIFLIALIGMQLVRHENLQISLLQFVQPFLFLTVPYLFVLAALTVLFDVFPGIKGVFGNILIFGIWISLLSVSTLVQDRKYDLFGIGTMLKKMLQDAQTFYPEIHSNVGGLGFNMKEGISSTFTWEGMMWSAEFLGSRLAWIGVALLIIFLSALLFDRFIETERAPRKNTIKHHKGKLSLSGIEKNSTLSPVTTKKISLLKVSKSELKIMLSGCSFRWRLAILTSIFISPIISLGSVYNYISLIMLLPISIWSQMGCREKYYFTSDLVKSSCPLLYKRMAEWLAGFVLTVLVSSGVLIRFALLGEWEHLAAWSIGILFIPTLALLFGFMSGNRKLFEAVYIAWFYFGPINGVPFFDFLGIRHRNMGLYSILTCALMVFTYFLIWYNENHIELYHKKRSRI